MMMLQTNNYLLLSCILLHTCEIGIESTWVVLLLTSVAVVSCVMQLLVFWGAMKAAIEVLFRAAVDSLEVGLYLWPPFPLMTENRF